VNIAYHKHTMFNNFENTLCFDSVCEYADSRGIFCQRCSTELSVRYGQSQSEREQASSVDVHARLILWEKSSILKHVRFCVLDTRFALVPTVFLNIVPRFSSIFVINHQFLKKCCPIEPSVRYG